MFPQEIAPITQAPLEFPMLKSQLQHLIRLITSEDWDLKLVFAPPGEERDISQ